MASTTISKVLARRRLAVLWFIAGGVATALLGFRAHGAAGEAEYWKWFSPYVLPLTALMIGSLQGDEASADPTQTSTFYFRLCWGLLLFYALLLLGALVTGFNTPPDANAAADATQDPMLASLKSSALPLTAVQGVLSLALGVFFVKTVPGPPAPPAKPA